MKWFADFETTTANTDYYRKTGDTTVLVAGLMNENDTVYQIFSNLDSFMDYVIDNLKSADVLYFHHLSFDGNFITKWLFKHQWRPVNTIYELSHKTVYLFRDKAKIYEIVIGWRNKRIIIKCSYLLLCSGIDDIARDMGLKPKSEFMKDNPNFYDLEPQPTWANYPKAFIDYLRNDINVARIATINYMKAIKEKFNEFCLIHDVNKFLTTGALSFKLQQNAANNYNINPDEIMYCSIEEYDFYKMWFFGGLTQFNPTIQKRIIQPLEGKIIDINSAYPFAMTKALPIGKFKNLKDESPPENATIYYYYHLKIKSAHAKYLQTPFLRNWNATKATDNRYVFMLENFECYYLKQEFDILTKYYDFDGVEFVDIYWCEAKPFLSEYINTIYDLKTYYKKQKNKSGQFLYKILLNAGYGKYAQRYALKREFWVPTKDKERILKAGVATLTTTVQKYFTKHTISEEYYVYPLTKLTAVDNVAGMSNIAVLKKEIKRAHNILIAATITALNRVLIMETVLKINPKNFYYCDTDSIFFDATNVDLTTIEIDTYKLGAWDFESNLKKFVVLGAKAYWAEGSSENKVKFSGVNKRFLEEHGIVDWFLGENDNNVIEGATLKRKETPSGIVLVVDDYEIKERKH